MAFGYTRVNITKPKFRKPHITSSETLSLVQSGAGSLFHLAKDAASIVLKSERARDK